MLQPGLSQAPNIKAQNSIDGKTEVNYFNESIEIIVKAGMVNVLDNCFGYMATNLGDSIVTINGMTLFPSSTPATASGDSKSIGGHKNDLYKGIIRVAFNGGTGTNNKLELVQLAYMKNYNK